MPATENPAEKPHVYVPPGEQPPAELVIEDLEVGDGAEATAGASRRGPLRRRVVAHPPAVRRVVGPGRHASRFRLGGGQVITGWDEGVAGMKVGGRRRLVIPPAKAYGKQGAGGVIGPNETLVFVVDLLGVS